MFWFEELLSLPPPCIKYLQKTSKSYHLIQLDTILQDPLKFQRLRRNPIEDIKREVNNIIDIVNAVRGTTHLHWICGDDDDGYIYGSVKTHKPGDPLRPIVSHVSYTNILTPYVPMSSP